MKLALAIVGEYINTIIRIIGFIVWLPIIIIGLIVLVLLTIFCIFIVWLPILIVGLIIAQILA